MAKFLPIIQVQKDLRAKLQAAKLADYFERLAQSEDDTLHAILRAAEAEGATIVVKDEKDLPPDLLLRKAGFAIVGSTEPMSRCYFVTPQALLALVKEAKAIYANAQELLDWMKEKKLDQ